MALVVTLALGVISIPIVISVGGASAWASIAIAQSIAAIVAIGVSFGWGILGPAWVAAAKPDQRGQLAWGAIAVRSGLALIGVPIYLLIVSLTAPNSGDLPVAMLGGGATLAGAVSFSWFLAGEARPLRMLVLDTLPRALGTGAGLVIMVASDQVLYFVGSQFVGALLAAVATIVDVVLRNAFSGNRQEFIQRTLSTMRRGVYAVSTSGISSVFVNLPLVLLANAIGGGAVTFAMGDRLVRYGVLAMTPVQRVFQSFVPAAPSREQLLARIQHSLNLTFLLAVVFGLGYVLLAPAASAILSGDEVHLPFSISAPLGLALASITITGITGLVIFPPLRAEHHMALSTITGCVFGLPLILTASNLGSPTLMAWGAACAEVAVAAHQLIVLAILMRRARRRADA
jgi:hypothetical protein